MSKNKIISVVLICVSVLPVAGVLTVFSACPVSDVKVMPCHYAQNVVAALGIASAVISVIHFLSSQSLQRIGLSVGLVALSVISFAVPDHLISLCKMESMHCRVFFEPFVHIMSAVLLVTAVIDLVINLRAQKK
ncbi:MAG: DUF4418 family protein [Succinivibrio sp.]